MRALPRVVKLALLAGILLVVVLIARSCFPNSHHASQVPSEAAGDPHPVHATETGYSNQSQHPLPNLNPRLDSDAGRPEPIRHELRPENAVDCVRDGTGRLNCGDCSLDSDCPAGRGCVLDPSARRTVCLGSNCQHDSDCPAGVCLRLTGGTASSTVVQRCTPRGDRQLNAPCLGVGTVNRCAAGLECSIAAGGICRPSCESADCPADQQCVREDLVSVCVSACRQDSDCGGNGLSCELVSGTLKQCLRRVGENCLLEDAGCGVGEQCVRSLRAGTIRFACRVACDPLAPSCPDRGVCGSWGTRSVCFSPCNPENFERDCPAQHTCSTVDEEGTTWGCMPRE